jgi:hypothetical protein
MITTSKESELQTGDPIQSFIRETVKQAVEQILHELIPTLSNLNPPTGSNKTAWKSRQEVANKFGVSLPTVDLHTKKGTLKAHYFGRRVLYDENELNSATVPFGSILKNLPNRGK